MRTHPSTMMPLAAAFLMVIALATTARADDGAPRGDADAVTGIVTDAGLVLPYLPNPKEFAPADVDAIARQLRGLDHRVQSIRVRAESALANLPASAENVLLYTLALTIPAVAEFESARAEGANLGMLRKPLSLRQRQGITLALAMRRSEAALPYILGAAAESRSGEHGFYSLVIGRYGDAGWRALAVATFGAPDPAQQFVERPRQPNLESIYSIAVRQRVVDFMLEQLDAGGRTGGYYDSQYAPLFVFGVVAYEALADLVRGVPEMIGPFTRYDVERVKTIAARAIGDSGDVDALPILQALVREFGITQQSLDANGGSTEGVPQSIVYSLYNLGDTKLCDDYVQSINGGRSAANISDIAQLNQLASIFLYTKRYELAVAHLSRVVDLGDSMYTGVAHYNLGCAYSKLGDTESAMQAVKKALNNGFTDFEWMFRDHDLENLWGTDDFKSWIDELRQHPVYMALIPGWEPGNPPRESDQ